MDKILAKKGQKIKRGDVIGYLGNTGLSTGPHLHYEVRKNDKPIDPINFYFNDLTPDEFELLVETANNTGQSMDWSNLNFRFRDSKWMYNTEKRNLKS